jgi:hypothetical protein
LASSKANCYFIDKCGIVGIAFLCYAGFLGLLAVRRQARGQDPNMLSGLSALRSSHAGHKYRITKFLGLIALDDLLTARGRHLEEEIRRERPLKLRFLSPATSGSDNSENPSVG